MSPPTIAMTSVDVRRANWNPACVPASLPSDDSTPRAVSAGLVMLLGARAGNTRNKLWEQEKCDQAHK